MVGYGGWYKIKAPVFHLEIKILVQIAYTNVPQFGKIFNNLTPTVRAKVLKWLAYFIIPRPPSIVPARDYSYRILVLDITFGIFSLIRTLTMRNFLFFAIFTGSSGASLSISLRYATDRKKKPGKWLNG